MTWMKWWETGFSKKSWWCLEFIVPVSHQRRLETSTACQELLGNQLLTYYQLSYSRRCIRVQSTCSRTGAPRRHTSKSTPRRRTVWESEINFSYASGNWTRVAQRVHLCSLYMSCLFGSFHYRPLPFRCPSLLFGYGADRWLLMLLL